MLQPVDFLLTGQTDTDRGPSPAIWKGSTGCPVLELLEDPGKGLYFFDDFLTSAVTVPTTAANFGKWMGFTSTGGTLNPATQVRGGVLTLGSDGDDEGASIQSVIAPYQIIRGDGKLWFEARWKINSTAVTQSDVFVGLAEAMTLSAVLPITATAGTLADKNLVGFQRPGTSTTGDGSSLRTTYKADGVTAVTVETIAAAVTADTYIKTGFIFDPEDNYLRFYVNNVLRATAKQIPSAAGTDFPNDVLLSPTVAVLNTAAATSLLTLDWIRVAQLYP